MELIAILATMAAAFGGLEWWMRDPKPRDGHKGGRP
jgi:hypothetical protein